MFLTENEKCMLTQALNEQREYLQKSMMNGFIPVSDYRNDNLEIDYFKECFKNSLWK